MSKHNELGAKGEMEALKFLEKQAYTILEINWRYEKAEVDIIAKQGKTVVFIEVKTRNTDFFGFPEESVGKEKQKNIALAAEAYIEKHKLSNEIRFDVIAITMKKSDARIVHIKDAFFAYE